MVVVVVVGAGRMPAQPASGSTDNAHNENKQSERVDIGRTIQKKLSCLDEFPGKVVG